MKLQLSLLLLIISLSAPAQITTDGTVGPPQNLPGPNYQIGTDLGQQRGGNLFHSFQDFNLQSHESATFSGPNHIQNVISRVTGGNPSNIDGLFRSTIPGADVYFLNPDGIMFGPHAKLDVQGSFHASTADYLRLGDGGRFDARNPSDSLLTVAPIESFGFLTDIPAKITTQSSKLFVPSDKTLSLIGGDIHLTSDTPLMANHSRRIPLVKSESILAAEHGRMNLASLASRGKVILDENDLTLQGKGGQITVENTLIEMSGNGGGAVFIRAGQFFLDNAIIQSNTYGNIDGKSITLKLTEAAIIKGLNSEISVTTATQNDAGGLLIEVPYLEVIGATIATGSYVAGKAGNIEILAVDVKLKDGAFLSSGSLNTGQSGNIKLEVSNSLSLTGFSPGYRLKHGAEYENARTIISSVSVGTGHSGNILINTKHLNMTSTVISANAFEASQGGDVTINAQQVRLIDGAVISNMNLSQAQTGYLKINITDKLYIAGKTPFAFTLLGITFPQMKSGVQSSSLGIGTGGTIDIQANDITITNGGQITANSLVIGNAGDIFIQAENLQIRDNGQITTSAEHAVGGNLHLTIPRLLYLQEGEITTSVHGGTGDGGNITLENPTFVILNQGQIKAQADAGHGGNIRIVAEQFINSCESFVSASSRLGLDGNIQIDSPTVDLSGALLVLATDFDASGELKPPCSLERTAKEKQNYSLVVKSMTGSPPSPYDWKATRLILLPVSLEKTNPAKTPPPQKDTMRGSSALTLKAVSLSGCQSDLSKPTHLQTKAPSMSVEKSVIPDQLF